jgi:hypothetical protein
MKYRAMAKHFIYESAVNREPRSDLDGLVEGHTGKPELTPGEYEKFLEAWRTELDKMREKLEIQQIIV